MTYRYLWLSGRLKGLQITLDHASDPGLQPFGFYGLDKVAEDFLLLRVLIRA